MTEQQASTIIALLTSIDEKLELMIGSVLAAAPEPESAHPAITSWDDAPPTSGVQMRGG